MRMLSKNGAGRGRFESEPGREVGRSSATGRSVLRALELRNGS